MDFGDDLWLRQAEQVVVAFQVLHPILEPLAAVGGFVELVALQRRAHRAVNDDDALAEELF
jgi:hypothetical protein